MEYQWENVYLFYFFERSPHPRYTFIWDLDVVLIKFTKSNWEVNLDLSLIDFTWKLAMLAIFKALNVWQNQRILYLDNLLNLRLGAKRPFVAFYAINFYVFFVMILKTFNINLFDNITILTHLGENIWVIGSPRLKTNCWKVAFFWSNYYEI